MIKQNKEKEARLSLSELKQLFFYNPDSGLFIRRVSKGNAKAGDIAGFDNGGYVQIQINKSAYLAHRLAYFYLNGVWPVNEIDHINGCRSDNRASNLRSVSLTENSRNRSIPTNSSSGVIGVSWSKKLCKWVAYISDLGKRKHLGVFSDFEDAKLVRVESERTNGYHVNHGKQRKIK